MNKKLIAKIVTIAGVAGLGIALTGVPTRAQEFGSPEVKDVVNDAVLPPLSVIEDSKKKQVAALEAGDMLWSLEIGASITVRVFLQELDEKVNADIVFNHPGPKSGE